MIKYIDTLLIESAQILYEIASLDTDTEIELSDDIFITYHQDNPYKIEVRHGLDEDDVVEYDISNGFDKLLSDYGNLIIEQIR